MKQIFCTMLAILAWAVPAGAGVLERVAETKTLRIGYRTDSPPFSYEPQKGEIAGYSVDLCRAVADTLKADLKLDAIAIQYIAVTAENRFQAIQDGAIDILCGPTSVTLARREIVDFSLQTFVDGAGLMVRPGVSISSLNDLATMKLAVSAGTTTESAVRSSFPNASILTVTDHTAGLQALKDSAADAYFADRTLLAFLKLHDPAAGALRIADEYLTIEPYALALPKGDSDFRLAVDKTISRVLRSPKLRAIVQRSFGGVELGNLVEALYRIVPIPN
jgi:ABC-type amino acid transport substrate-binding protein